MSRVGERYDLSDAEARESGLSAAVAAVRRGRLVLLPTDTVYGVGADAFDPEAVDRLLRAKGRGREMPPPVLISTSTTLSALTTEVPSWVEGLVARFWPGPLTLVCRQQPSLRWDLGETRGTVAVRMPDDDGALDLLGRTGPLAVSSANRTGEPAALDADAAEAMLGDSVEVVLDGGASPGQVASTILDVTSPTPRVLREGAVSTEELREVLEQLGAPVTELGDDPQEEPGGA
jgi:L-threonylcarbamoyladenylate synthase